MRDNKQRPSKKRSKGFYFLSITAALSIVGVTAASCASGPGVLVFANFESYMSPDLQSELQAKNRNVQFDFYSSNENMISNFNNGTYTIGTPSTYALIELIESNSLVKLDWSKFGLYGIEHPDKMITTADDALELFTPVVQDVLTGYQGAPYHINNLLEYSVPYFLQSYIFAYRGDEITELNHNPTWADIFDYIGTHPDRFNNGRLGAVEDERSLFSVSQLINNLANHPNNITVNPDPNDPKPSLETYTNILQEWCNGQRISNTTLGSNPVPIFLNSDSNIIINLLALGNLNGAFLFNGDAISAAQGGDLASDESNNNVPDGNNFHIVSPELSVLALDNLVINKVAINQNENLLNEAYDLIKTTSLQGADTDDLQKFADTQKDTTGKPIKNLNGDGDLYVNGPMQNFDYVIYTSPLNIISGNDNSVINDTYFPSGDENNPSYDKPLYDEILKAYNIKTPTEGLITDFIEAPLNAWQKQVMINAYLRFKETEWK